MQILPQFEPQSIGPDTLYPADPLLEEAVIGAILLDPPAIEKIPFVEPSDFHLSHYAKIFRIMCELYAIGSNIDPVLIADRDLELLSICTEAYSNCPSSLHIVDYATKLRELAQKRNMIQTLGKASQMAFNHAPYGAVHQYVQGELDNSPPMSASNFFERWQGQGITAAEAANLGMIERSYLVEDLIREKSLSIFFGGPGELKSAAVMDMGFCIANGRPWLERLPVEGNVQKAFTTRKARVLWLNYDQSHDDVIERLGAMARVYGGGENVMAISQSSPPAILQSEHHARGLGDYCSREGYRLLIVDSLLDVKGKADLQEAAMGDLLRLWRVVTEIGNLSVVIIAHNTKQSGDLYGSQFIKAKLDHLYLVTRPPGTDVAILESKKQRSFGEQNKLFARFTYRHFDGTRTLETARFFGDSTEDRPAHPNNTTQAAILRILMESPGRGFLVNELTEILNEHSDADDAIDSNAVRKAASRLADNERKVGKTPLDGKTNLYHYGELGTNSDGHINTYR